MAEDKKGFILYADQKELFNQLPNDKAGELIKHIFAYVNDENPITEDLIINMAFTPIKQQFKRDLEKWQSTRESRSKAGIASAKARANKKQQSSTNSTSVDCVQQDSTNPTVNVNVNVNDNVNDNVKDIQTFTRDSFLLWFKECREYLGLKYNAKKLTFLEQQAFDNLKDYSTDEFKLAFKNFSKSKYYLDNNLIMPINFLKEETFIKYLNAEVKKELTVGQKLMGGIE
tara:strand:+ start:1248 stop:1934 length:687 start_codon:yes stop_codon:yes gene_type:complete